MLGVRRDASDDEIKEAYRDKVKQYHPDICDREDAEELFKQVKNAYEGLHSGGSMDTGPDSAQDKKSPSAGADSTEKPDGSRKEKRKTGSGKEKSGSEQSTGFTARAEEDTGDRDDRGQKEDGFSTDHSQCDTDSDGAPDDFEVVQGFEDGWLLGRRQGGDVDEDGRWFVFKEFETAPHIDEKEFTFLAGDGAITKEPTYFNDNDAAEEVYRSAFGKEETDEEYGYEHETQTTHRRYSPKGESYTHVSTEKSVSTNEVGWGKIQKKTNLDELWSLYYQERSRGEERRWSVVASVAGDNRCINHEGGYQETEFWFNSREDAEDAHRRYMEKMSDAGEENERDRQASGDSRRQHGRRSSSVSAESNAAEALWSLVERKMYNAGKVSQRAESRIPDSVLSLLSYILKKVYFSLFVVFSSVYVFVAVTREVLTVLRDYWVHILSAYALSSVGLLVLGFSAFVSFTVALGITVSWMMVKFLFTRKKY